MDARSFSVCGIQALAFKRVFCSGDQCPQFLWCYIEPGIILENNIKIILLVKSCIDLVLKKCKEAVKMADPVSEHLHNSISHYLSITSDDTITSSSSSPK